MSENPQRNIVDYAEETAAAMREVLELLEHMTGALDALDARVAALESAGTGSAAEA